MGARATAVDAWEALFRAQVTVLRAVNAEFPTGELSLNEYDVLFNLSRRPALDELQTLTALTDKLRFSVEEQ